jgi:acid stress-induced BolA-like protein IbaG/YrbA
MLQDILTKRLNLDNPQFSLQKIGPKFSGSVISNSFKGKRDLKRQQMIWDALDAELGADSVHVVGTIFAYTPDEWNIALEATG